MKWKEKVYRTFTRIAKEDPTLNKQYADLKFETSEVGIHLAVFGEPFLTLLLDGRKTVESRFSLNNISPFAKVSPGDFVFIKKTGGPICGYFIVKESHYFKTANRSILEKIKKNFGKQICDDAIPDFWKTRQSSNYISLLEVAKTGKLAALEIEKRDRTAWTVIRSSIGELIA